MREILKNSTAGCDDDLLFYNKWKQQPKKNNLLNHIKMSEFVKKWFDRNVTFWYLMNQQQYQ